mmetsp:Transcript_10702/g.12519  ORF Transcript_10702/g.12519 Transcript_10702/m.12519 type:complete len:954 (-) Transcript_10702:448-3309(-)|eukprot:CAMPEP_0197860624 /NCGR_PEP_ID=MMETSP1438-20131217/36112_1 /TAXON_ID=1461541 /ORGANISM="Pterosperma sp., Strain CCMP1384" /LENGTH=953 /DNA_ID=CAMNT_0043477557 /DNA_START=83 /DNA_END=2944 /DNA_ORIENTATION=+
MLRLARQAGPLLRRGCATELQPYHPPLSVVHSPCAGARSRFSSLSQWWNSGAAHGSSSDPEDKSNNAEDPSNKANEKNDASLLVPGSPSPANHPQVLVVPVSRRPLFPGMLSAVKIRDEKLVAEIMDRSRRGQAYVGAFLRKPADMLSSEGLEVSEMADGEVRDGPLESDDMHDVGAFAAVHHIVPQEGGGASLVLLGHRRIVKTDIVAEDPLEVSVNHLKDEPFDAKNEMLKASSNEVVATIKDLLKVNPIHQDHLKFFSQHVGDFQEPSRLADLGAGLCSVDSVELQEILEELNVPSRLHKVLVMLKKEVDLGKLQQKIGKKVEEKISSEQRRYFLMEQLKSIKKELGLEKDDKSELIGKFREKFAQYSEGASEEVKKVVEEELVKLSNLEPSSSEFNITRTYLEWLTAVPWGHTSVESLDVEKAMEILDAEHHGLEDVKERILEFIAVALLRGSTQGKIMCLVGPPGVGKTSIGKSIAKALNREYFRFSVGGMSDVAEIKGHRRTYVGAMPGKLVQCVKSTGTVNPLVLIDEIDKLRVGHTGDPASALLELLDPEQNNTFRDHYLDVPLDMSKVLFMCTANVAEHIPGPLLDRMEVVRLSGYIAEEKKAIGRRHLEPTAKSATGLDGHEVTITDDAFTRLVEEYCRESGVRSLKNHIERIFRKVALKLVKAGAVPPPKAAAMEAEELTSETTTTSSDDDEEHIEEAAIESPEPLASPWDQPKGEESKAAGAQMIEFDPIVISGKNLQEYVGLPKFKTKRIYDMNPVGVVTGLAWTSMGGDTLDIEAAVVTQKEGGSASIRTTGQLGSVMTESADIAHSYARYYLSNMDPENQLLNTASIHIHCPAGAVPKDGPSAGITLVTALLSVALNRPIKHGLAMTGEVSLTGRVLPIGGVKEKVIAARRAGLDTLVFPSANQSDFDDVDDALTEGLTVHFVDKYDEVFKVAFPEES